MYPCGQTATSTCLWIGECAGATYRQRRNAEPGGVADRRGSHEQLLYLEDLLRNEGLTYTTSNRLGELMIKSRPEVQIHKQCKDFELRILCEFGLTPSARARVPYKPQSKKKNAFADLDETG